MTSLVLIGGPSGLTTFFILPERRAIRTRLESTAIDPGERANWGTEAVARER